MSKRQDPKNKATPKRKATKPAEVADRLKAMIP